MRLTRRTGLVLIVGLAILGGILVAASGAIADIRVRDALVTIRDQHLPKMKLGPKLDAQLERIRRGFQDAVAAHDVEVLGTTHLWLDEVSEILADAQPSLSSSDAGAIRNAFKRYYAAGLAVSRRLMNDETGESLLQSIRDMQEGEKYTAEVIARVTAVDPERLDLAFGDIVRAQTMVARVRLGIIVGFLTVIAVIAVFLAGHLRAEEERREAVMMQASRELDALSSPLAEGVEPIDLAQLARDCATLIKQSSSRAFELAVDNDLRAAIDPALARLLIEALMKHAWNSTASAADARIEVGAVSIAAERCFFVRANGNALDPTTAQNLFSATIGFGGLRRERSELGTAQRVVRRCGGRIWAETSPARGTTINFTLPAPQNRSS